MTSSLPTFLASPAAPAAAPALVSAALAGLMPPAGSAPASPAGVAGLPLDFATMLATPTGAATGASAATAPAANANAMTVDADGAPAGTNPNAGTVTLPVASAGHRSRLPVTLVWPRSAGPAGDQAGGSPAPAGAPHTLRFVIAGKTLVVKAPAGAGAGQPVRVPEISSEEYEQAAAFVAALMQVLLPAASPAPETVAANPDSAVPALPGPGAGGNATLPAGVADSLWHATKPGQVAPNENQVNAPVAAAPTLPEGRDCPTVVPNRAEPSLAAERFAPAQLPAAARPALGADRDVPSVPDAAPEAEPLVTGNVPLGDATGVLPLPESTPVFTVAADGAIELKLNLTPARETALSSEARPPAPLEVSAELELPGQAVVRIEATVTEAHGFTATGRAVNFAGRRDAQKSRDEAPAAGFERNFVFTGDKQVKASSPESGITVAKTGGKMPVAPTEENRTTRNPDALSVLPSRADFQVVQSPAERITAAPTEPAGQNFAERAVATVTGLAEAQFSASMNKAGSVQLRLKFGGEDLSVRVELRDGAVHTDFRTDSPELRAAISKEWQAVAASAPGQLQRFLDPVFSPGSAAPSTDAGSQQQASHRQSPQQQAQDQAGHRPADWSAQSPFSRRSALSESFVPEPATPRMPVLLPTSLRLSVLA